MKILPSITTTGFAPFLSDWREKISKIKELGLKEFCFFPTCLKKSERKEAYGLFKEKGVKNISFIHLRTDMDFEEIDYLVKNFEVKAFNVHSESEYPFIFDYSKSKYKKMVFVENVYKPLNEKEIKKLGGICLDFTHLENDRIMENKKFNHNIKILDKCLIGCNHISAFKKTTHIDESGSKRYDNHFVKDFSELDYLKNYPKNYFSDLAALELENKLEDQLQMIDYINNLFKK